MIIYTDGSKSEEGVGAGAGAIFYNNNNITIKRSKLANHCSVYQAKCLPLRKHLRTIENETLDKTIIINSDSELSLKTLVPPNYLHQQITKSIEHIMKNNNKIFFKHVLAQQKLLEMNWPTK